MLSDFPETTEPRLQLGSSNTISGLFPFYSGSTLKINRTCPLTQELIHGSFPHGNPPIKQLNICLPPSFHESPTAKKTVAMNVWSSCVPCVTLITHLELVEIILVGKHCLWSQ